MKLKDLLSYPYQIEYNNSVTIYRGGREYHPVFVIFKDVGDNGKEIRFNEELEYLGKKVSARTVIYNWRSYNPRDTLYYIRNVVVEFTSDDVIDIEFVESMLDDMLQPRVLRDLDYVLQCIKTVLKG